MYTDDTNLTAFSNDLHSLQTILNSELNNIHQWLVANKLTLNVDKTEYMIIGTRQKLNHLPHDMEVHIGEKKLKQVTSNFITSFIILWFNYILSIVLLSWLLNGKTGKTVKTPEQGSKSYYGW